MEIFGSLRVRVEELTEDRIGMFSVHAAAVEEMCTLADELDLMQMEDKNLKNVQIIDDAINTTYGIYTLTDEEFATIFPDKHQNIEFIEDVVERIGDSEVYKLMEPVWDRVVNKEEVDGIHGTLFYGLADKKPYYPTKNEPPINDRLVD